MSEETKPTSTPVTVDRRYPAAPMVGVAAAVFDAKGDILLVQRDRPPGAGTWGLPGGLLDLGERLADGARREVWEECAVHAEIVDVIGAFEPILRDENGRIEYHYVVVDFWGRYAGGDATARDDARAVAWVSMQDLDAYRLAPESVRVIDRAYAAWLATATK